MGGRHIAGLVAVLLAGASVAPAAAAPTRLGPAPAAFWQVGSDLFFATSRAHSTFDRWQLHRRPSGGSSRVVASVDTDRSGNANPDLFIGGTVAFFPTPSHVGISERNVTETGTDAGGDVTLSFGRYGSAGTTVARCGASDGEPELRPVAADGTTIAYLRPPCDLSPAAPETLVLHDAGGAADRTVAIAPAPVDVAGVALAGPFAAYAAAGSISVVDRATGAPVYHVAAGAPFVLQADGKVAWAANTHFPCVAGALEWASPAEPTAHGLSVGACSVVRFAGDRIVYGTGSATRAVTLAGADRALLPFDRGVSVDGSRIAFVAPGCAGGTLWSGSLDDPALAPPVQRSCPLRVTGRRLIVRAAAVRVPLSCPRGCSGLLTLGTRTGRWADVSFKVTGRRVVKLPLNDSPPSFRAGQRRAARVTVFQDLPSGRQRVVVAAVAVSR
ncbi:MAG: hypothetical protein JWN32_1320 [Solirubrobacterales bacterium]|nr:hypothetical protein [Solirubrobacterales bacterium]